MNAVFISSARNDENLQNKICSHCASRTRFHYVFILLKSKSDAWVSRAKCGALSNTLAVACRLFRLNDCVVQFAVFELYCSHDSKLAL